VPTAFVYEDSSVGWRAMQSTDLPNSGVTAATYGDSTHVAQVAVSAQGVVTSASNVAISGLAGTGLVSLFDSTLGGAAASIDTGAGGIAAGHGDLIIWVMGRTADASVNVDVLLRFNNDSGANYNYAYVRNDGTGTPNAAGVTGATAARPGQITGNNATASTPGSIQITVPSYDQTTFHKVGTAQSGPVPTTLNNQLSFATAFTWQSTAAISRIAVSSQIGGNLQAGTRLVVYGTK
jgi:hypothetical protein